MELLIIGAIVLILALLFVDARDILYWIRATAFIALLLFLVADISNFIIYVILFGTVIYVSTILLKTV
jgi:hypothetical protein